MLQETWTKEIMGLDVLDTHTHLVGEKLPAQDFWQIAHYFWFLSELRTGGYPMNAEDLPEEERIPAFLAAYRATRNTNMNWVFTQILKELYGIEITDEASIRKADAAIRESSKRPSWAQEVADKLSIRRFVVNNRFDSQFEGMREQAIIVPRIDGKIGEWTKNIQLSEDPRQAFDEIVQALDEILATFKKKGYPGIMTTLPRYDTQANHTYEIGKESTRDEIMMMLLHAACGAAEREGLFVQLFVGVERSWCGTAVPANDPERILKLSGLFDKYAIPFELIVASEINNMDVVQAAWNFPNVHVGGMWWFNFRASTYRQSMQYRLEGMAPMKSSLVVSDARCIEWSFGKIFLIKRLTAEFLFKQMEDGWLDEETARMTAKEWLYDSAARRYGILNG